MMQFSLAFAELMGNSKSKYSNQQHHTISNKTDAIILTTGYIRALFNNEQIPICIINIIIEHYYLNEKEEKESNLLESPSLTLSKLKVGDKIDCRDDWEKYYAATILFIKSKHEQFPINNNIQRLSVSPGIKYLYPNDWNSNIGLFIHYNGCSSRYDEWIFVKPHSICDCNDICSYKDLHFIAKPYTQSKQIGLKQLASFQIPNIKNTVGLANEGGISWLNSILQSLYHSNQFKQFIVKQKYLNQQQLQLIQKNKRYYHNFIKDNQFLIKLHDLFSNLQSNEFNVVSPDNLQKVILSETKKGNKKSSVPLEFDENCDKPFQFLMWTLNKLSIKHDIINTLFEGRYQIQIHQDIQVPHNLFDRYKSLPPKQYKFLSLELPIINGMKREFVIDVYDSRNNNQDGNGLNPPIRIKVQLPRDGKVSDLESYINKLYNVNSDHESIFFYRLWGFRCCYVWNSFEPLNDVDDNIACYIINNWTPTNHICHLHHVRPMHKPELDEMNNNDNNNNGNNNGHPDINLIHDNYPTDTDSDSDIDIDIDTDTDCIQNNNSNNNNNSILKHHYHHHHKNVHMNDKHVITPYAFGQPFIVSFPHNETTGRLVHKIIYHRLYSWIGDDNILPKPPPILNEDDTSEDIEQEWDILLVNLPYTLRWVHKDYNFYFDGYKPPIVSCEAVPINYTWNYHANIVIEWNQKMYPIVKPLFNIIKNADKQCVHDPDRLSIYDCLDQYMIDKLAKHNVENDDEIENDDQDKQLKLWALPEYLVIHLPRFYKFKVERLNKCMTRQGFIPSLIDYPLKNLDLSKYMAEELTMNAKYDLFSVCCHSGTNHYYSLCKKEYNDQWYKFEDKKVTKIDKVSVVNNKALVLFYKKTKQNNRLESHCLFNQYF